MNQFFKLQKSSLKLFVFGLIIGFLVVQLFPKVGEYNYAFQMSRVKAIKPIFFGMPASVNLSLIILFNNFSIALIISILPLILFQYISINRRKRSYEYDDSFLKFQKEIYFTSTLYSFAVLFFYGFFVFGLFLGYISIPNSFQNLFRWFLYFIPHGILETLAMIMAASTSIVIRDNWLRSFKHLKINILNKALIKEYLVFLCYLFVLFVLSAIIEVYISNNFVTYFIK